MEIRSWLESLKKRGMQLGLDSTKELLNAIGNPQDKFPSIHVAGSNGKGSCCYIMAKLMKYKFGKEKVGLFTSPHLCHVEERIRINGKLINPEYFDKILETIRDAVEQIPEINPTFYETTFVAAMIAFSEQNVEWAIIETGLGGRLDATKLVKSKACVLTSISLEHTDVLGNTIEEIAAEKAAIVPKDTPLVAVWNESENARKVIENSVSSQTLGFWYDPVSSFFFNFGVDPREHEVGTIMAPKDKLELSLDYRQEGNYYDPTFLRSFLNDALLIARFVLYELLRLKPDENHISFPIEDFLKFPGRMQEIQINKAKKPIRLILDSAHNPSGIKRAFLELQEKYTNKKAQYIILGTSPQNNLNDFLDPIIEYCINNENVTLILTQPEGGRYEPIGAKDLENEIKKQLPQANTVVRKSAYSALEELLNEWDNYSSKTENKEGFAICIGSLYLAGNILSSLRKNSFEDFSF